MSVGGTVWRFGGRKTGRHLVSTSRLNHVLIHGGLATRVAQGGRRKAIVTYKPGLPSFRKRWGDSDVGWSVQTAVGQGFSSLPRRFFRGEYRQIL
jgi:hypothetical protein